MPVADPYRALQVLPTADQEVAEIGEFGGERGERLDRGVLPLVRDEAGDGEQQWSAA